MKPYKFIISGGGTGGHIFPAIAIAKELQLRYQNATFLFIGAIGRMEMLYVPKAGFTIKGIWITGFNRSFRLKNLLFPLKLVISIIQSLFIYLSYRPSFVIGTGGFASGPILWVSSLFKTPYLIQEQNAYAGVTNKLLGKKAEKIAVAYDGMERFFAKEKIVKTGIPIRKELLTIDKKENEAKSFYKLNENKKVLAIIGGSLGAAKINSLIEEKLDFLKELDVQIIWQCGKLYYSKYKKYHNQKENILVYDFITDIDLFYAASDFIISRAGAGAISELTLVGKPLLLIPSPNVAEDHQTHNAKKLADKKAAIFIPECDLDKYFEDEIKRLVTNYSLQQEMKKNLKRLAMPNATKDITDIIDNLLNEK